MHVFTSTLWSNDYVDDDKMTWQNQRPPFTNNFFALSSTNHYEVVIYYYEVTLERKKLFIKSGTLLQDAFPFATTIQVT